MSAQSVNKKGEKVVRRIERYSPDAEKPYMTLLFKYNAKLELAEITADVTDAKKIVWRKNDGRIERTEYDSNGNVNKTYDVRYTVEGGLVTERTCDEMCTDGSTFRRDFFFRYGSTGEMESITEFQYDREQGKGFVELSDRYIELFSWDFDGNVYSSDQRGWNWRNGEMPEKFPINYKERKYYVALLNDTNVDLTKLCLWKTGADTVEETTEWFGRHSAYIMEEDWPFCYVFKCDEKGNAVRADIYKGRIASPDRRLEDIVMIYYLE